MKTWWDSSPYYVTGIYIGGISRSCHNEELNRVWATTVLGQGWNLMPLWPGEQAPCRAGSRTKNLFFFPHRFTLQNATRMGKAEADEAAEVANQLELEARKFTTTWSNMTQPQIAEPAGRQ